MEKRKNKMGEMAIPKLIFVMSLPAMLSMMTQALYNIVDSIFVAQINEEALTAVSLAFPIQLVIIACFVGMGVGISSLTSRKLGEKDYESVKATAEHGFFIGFILYVVIALLSLVVLKPFFNMFTGDTLIVQYGIQYLSIIMLFSFGRIFAQAGMSIMQGSGEMVIPMIAQLIGAGVNVILDPLLIFGLLGFPEMGVAGAAVATVIAQILSMLFVFLMVFKIKKMVVFNPFKFKYNSKILKMILKVGLPAAIMQALASVMITGLNVILAGFSTTAVAVLGVYYKLQSFVFMPIFGLSQGVMPIIGYNYGAKNKTRLLLSFKLSAIFALVYMSLGMAVFQIFPEKLIQLFNGTTEMHTIGRAAFKTISLSYPLAALAIISSTAFQGLGEAHFSMFVSFIRQIVVLLPLAYVISLFGKIELVWYAFVISEMFGAVAVILFLTKIYKQKVLPLDEFNSK